MCYFCNLESKGKQSPKPCADEEELQVPTCVCAASRPVLRGQVPTLLRLKVATVTTSCNGREGRTTDRPRTCAGHTARAALARACIQAQPRAHSPTPCPAEGVCSLFVPMTLGYTGLSSVQSSCPPSLTGCPQHPSGHTSTLVLWGPEGQAAGPHSPLLLKIPQ